MIKKKKKKKKDYQYREINIPANKQRTIDCTNNKAIELKFDMIT